MVVVVTDAGPAGGEDDRPTGQVAFALDVDPAVRCLDERLHRLHGESGLPWSTHCMAQSG